MENVNVVVLSGRLTKDPELRSLPSGVSVCALRLAVTKSVKGQDGTWSDAPCYFDVTVWSGQGESCARYLSRGSAVIVKGRLDWREWEAPDGGKRQAVSVVAERVEFGAKGDGGGSGQAPAQDYAPAPAAAAPAEDDIPF